MLIDSHSITVQHCTDLSTKSYKYVYIPKISQAFHTVNGAALEFSVLDCNLIVWSF